MSAANEYGEYGVSDQAGDFETYGDHENTPGTVFTSDVFPELSDNGPLDP